MEPMDISTIGRCNEEKFHKEKHIKYFVRGLDVLPSAYASLDTSRMTVLFFSLSGLDILNCLEKSLRSKKDIINWIYSLQIQPAAEDNNAFKCGFRGSPFLSGSYDTKGSFTASELYEGCHIAMTYTALCSLLILGDDLSRVNRPAVMAGLRGLQLEDGSYCSTPDGSEHDMRFIYCAVCICYILNDWSGIDILRAVDYISKSMSYDHGISQGPFLESHGGSTFCAIASLCLMDQLENCFSVRQLENLKRWCLVRQKSGFQGRPNKPVDTCYSFWVGASLKLLGGFELIDPQENRQYLLSTQNPMIGGFSKWPDFHPDALHTYFGICGLSLMNEPGLEPLHPALNITMRTFRHLTKVQQAAT